jgi:hypothetical protein
MSNKHRLDERAAFIEWRMGLLSWGAGPFKDALRHLCGVIAASPDPEQGYADLVSIIDEAGIVTTKAEWHNSAYVRGKPHSDAGIERQKKLRERRMEDYGEAAILVGNDFIAASKGKPKKVAIARAIERHFSRHKGSKLPDRSTLMRNINAWISAGELNYRK